MQLAEATVAQVTQTAISRAPETVGTAISRTIASFPEPLIEDDLPNQSHLHTCTRHAIAAGMKGALRAKYGLAVSHTQLYAELTARLHHFVTPENAKNVVDSMKSLTMHYWTGIITVEIHLHALKDFHAACQQTHRSAPYGDIIAVSHWPLRQPPSGKFHAMQGSRSENTQN